MFLRLIIMLTALFLTTFEMASCHEANPIEFRQFQQVIYLELTSETSANASVGDLDGDGDLDILLAKERQRPLLDRLFLNRRYCQVLGGQKFR